MLSRLYWRLRHPRRTVSDWRYSIKWAYQRARRGYSDPDLFDLDHALARLIIVGTESLQKGCGYPTGMTFEEWHDILAQIKTAFRHQVQIDEECRMQTPEEKAEFKRAGKLLLKYFWSLWD